MCEDRTTNEEPVRDAVLTDGGTAPDDGSTSAKRTIPDGGSETAPDGGVAREAGRPERVGGLRANLRLFYTLLRKDLIITIRYPVNLAGTLVSLFVIFVLVLEGGRRFGGPSFDDTVAGVVVGYLLFTMATTAYQSLASSILTEAGWGTLERLHMSPLGFRRVMLYQAAVRIVVSLLWTALILPPVLLISGQQLAIDPVTVLPIATLGVASVLGVGMIFGGAAVVYKRVQRIFQLFQFVLIALIAAPVGELPWLRAFPVVQANVMLGRAMRDGVRLWEFPIETHATLVGVTVAYVAVGYAVFLLFVRRARELGVLGDY